MYSHHIKGMTELICEIKRKTPKTVEAALESYWQNRIAITWSTEDVISCAEENNNAEITEEEARDILESVCHSHDASIGINWDTIKFAVDDKLDEKESDWIKSLDKKDLPLHVDRKWRTPDNKTEFIKRLEGQ